jgi:DNA recombination protein RmuC
MRFLVKGDWVANINLSPNGSFLRLIRMIESLLGLAVLLGLIAVGMLFVLLRRQVVVDLSPVVARLETLEKLQERGERGMKEEVARSRGESGEQARGLREELHRLLTNSNEVLTSSVDRISRVQKEKLDAFSTSLERLIESNHKKAEELRSIVEARLKELQADNGVKLEEMRKTVDEKLQGTLEKRLGESFKQVSDRLEAVHKGLGEMQSLATGVGDLKRVLTNVKARGTWGEVQLGNLLEQVLAPEQFERNVSPAGVGRAIVEYAIKLPGRDDAGKAVWLPIDAKFPKEDYERLVEAAEKNDPIAIEQAGKDLEARVKSQAKDIQAKYILPPHTTDFGLLYLPTEGLYAEVLRRPGLVDSIQRNQRVVVVGPTTLAALLNSLQMGFRTLAIQKQSSEVWKVLGAVKMEFGRFGEILDKVKKKIEETGSTIDQASVRSRAIEKSLRQVEALPATEAARKLTNEPAPELLFESRIAGK